jgi:hypothetical protein
VAFLFTVTEKVVKIPKIFTFYLQIRHFYYLGFVNEFTSALIAAAGRRRIRQAQLLAVLPLVVFGHLPKRGPGGVPAHKPRPVNDGTVTVETRPWM